MNQNYKIMFLNTFQLVFLNKTKNNNNNKIKKIK